MQRRDIAPYSNPSTSKAAALAIQPDLARLEETVLDFIRKMGEHGSTTEEAEKGLGMAHQTVSARFNGLMNKGYIVDTGRTRKNHSGREAIVWRLAKPGEGEVRKAAPKAKTKDQPVDTEASQVKAENATLRRGMAVALTLFRELLAEAEFNKLSGVADGYHQTITAEAVLQPGMKTARRELGQTDIDALVAASKII